MIDKRSSNSDLLAGAASPVIKTWRASFVFVWHGLTKLLQGFFVKPLLAWPLV
ncbi:hypothetical protein Q3C01_32120 [Bradyrhizobium sp. UFLA05-109]